MLGLDGDHRRNHHITGFHRFISSQPTGLAQVLANRSRLDCALILVKNNIYRA